MREREPAIAISTGQIWILIYDGGPVRMRVSKISPNGEIVLIEHKPRKDWIRVFCTTASSLYLMGELEDPRDRELAGLEDATNEVTEANFVRPVTKTGDDDAES